jgi:hypothetical protein
VINSKSKSKEDKFSHRDSKSYPQATIHQVKLHRSQKFLQEELKKVHNEFLQNPLWESNPQEGLVARSKAKETLGERDHQWSCAWVCLGPQSFKRAHALQKVWCEIDSKHDRKEGWLNTTNEFIYMTLHLHIRSIT